MKLSRPIQIGRYSIAGCDDWLVFAKDLREGRWVYWHTECDPLWNLVARRTGRTEAGLGDDPPVDIVAVGVLMAQRGDSPSDVDPEFQSETENHFGG